jgi:Ser/Thr protein kinase RdoA (MazF antagonist)
MANTAHSNAVPTSSPDWKAHLEARYSTTISQINQLDENVFRLDRLDGPSWVARVFDSSRPVEIVEGDAEILRFLEQQSFPAERCADPAPVSTTPSGHHVLITTFVEGRRPRKGEQLFPKLGDLLGRLHSLETGGSRVLTRRGGAWHHLCTGRIREEKEAALTMLKESRHNVPDDQLELYAKIQDKLQKMDDFEDLPDAFVHPDFVPSNVITTNDGELVAVDWAGSGTGPRAASLGFLLWAGGHRSMAQVEAVAKGYSKHVSLTETEMERLAAAIWFRHLVLRCWEFCTGRRKLEDVWESLGNMEELAGRIALVACTVFRQG